MGKAASDNGKSVWDAKSGELNGVEEVLNKYVPEKEREEIRRILYGSKA